MSGDVEVRCFHDLAPVAALRGEMDALCREAERPDPFCTLPFYENFLEHAEEADAGRPLWFLCAFRHGRLLGYLALRRSEGSLLGLRTRRLELLAIHDSDRPTIVCRPGDGERVRDAIIEYLRSRGKEWDSVQLLKQDPSSPLVALPDLMPGYYGRRMPGPDNARIAIRWPDLRGFHAACSKKMRNNLGRSMRRLFAAGEPSALRSDNPEAAGRLLELYRHAEAHAWKAATEAAVSRSAARIAYFRGLLDPRQPMRTSIGLLLLDGVPVAGLINGRYGRRMFALQTCYDARLSAMGPGRAMLLMGVREAIEHGVESYSLMSGFSYFKRHWQTELTPTVNVELYRPPTVAFAKALLGDVKRKVRPPAPDAGFNPARREAEEPEPAAVLAPLPPVASPEQRERFAEVLAGLRGLADVELLDAEALAAALPFKVRSAPAGAVPPAGRRLRPSAPAV